MKRFHHKYTLPAILLMLAIALALLFNGLVNLKKQTTLPPDANSSAIGVELNQDYGYVSMHELQANGISFVYLRSTQGRSYFDDDYLAYRDQILGTKLAFGTSVAYSDESTPQQHYTYFMKKVGSNTGSLPIMVIPAVSERRLEYIKQMAQFTNMLVNTGKRVMVDLPVKYKKYFPAGVLFITASKREPNKLQYAFWQYTTNGRVKNVRELEDGGVVMLAYNGTVTQYKQKYGQLTQ
ncbi:GH25 family lysozyme [Lactobacillus sp. ESL0701]|uniref:GH25 family lysozyme n=1 Tax=Lactobacillus sp. ESL0701 TaxID=2983217 RepID=UPI0023F8EF78|nr:GH25 family lysozyme [Lactobacillus sp. ESL0701]MDF7672295.1 GH25 family lysozyme [Lactobacillus sp. ESL0701]